MYTEKNESNLKNREKWEFTFKVKELTEALSKRVEHHKNRLAWWENEMEQAEAGLVNKGFEYRERRNSSGQELVVVGDPELANRVQECRSSITRHQEQKKYYDTWKRVLESQIKRDPQAALQLKYNDIEFFGL